MDILIISNSELNETNGSGYVVINTAKALSELGHRVKLIGPADFSFLSFLKSKATNYRRALGIAKWIVSHSKLIDSYQLIIFYGAEASFGLYTLKKILGKKIKTVLHSNGLEVHVDAVTRQFKDYLPQKKWYNIDHNVLFQYCYHHVDAIFTVSEYDRTFAVNTLRIPAQQVIALQPFLSDVYFSETGTVAVGKQKVITYCGSWISRKGVNIIKAIMPEILRVFPDYRLRLIGVGIGFKLEEYFPKGAISQIDLFPKVTDKAKLISLYKDTNIFLFPSFCESFGLVLAEAMLYNCAAITGPTGLAASLENGVDALVLQIPNEENVKRAVVELITDDTLRIKLQLQAPEKIKELTRPHYKRAIENAIAQVMKTETE